MIAAVAVHAFGCSIATRCVLENLICHSRTRSIPDLGTCRRLGKQHTSSVHSGTTTEHKIEHHDHICSHPWPSPHVWDSGSIGHFLLRQPQQAGWGVWECVGCVESHLGSCLQKSKQNSVWVCRLKLLCEGSCCSGSYTLFTHAHRCGQLCR